MGDAAKRVPTRDGATRRSPRPTADPEEVLLRRRELETNYRGGLNRPGADWLVETYRDLPPRGELAPAPDHRTSA